MNLDQVNPSEIGRSILQVWRDRTITGGAGIRARHIWKADIFQVLDKRMAQSNKFPWCNKLDTVLIVVSLTQFQDLACTATMQQGGWVYLSLNSSYSPTVDQSTHTSILAYDLKTPRIDVAMWPSNWRVHNGQLVCPLIWSGRLGGQISYCMAFPSRRLAWPV